MKWYGKKHAEYTVSAIAPRPAATGCLRSLPRTRRPSPPGTPAHPHRVWAEPAMRRLGKEPTQLPAGPWVGQPASPEVPPSHLFSARPWPQLSSFLRGLAPTLPPLAPRHLTAVRSLWAFFGSSCSFGVTRAVRLVRRAAGGGGDGRPLSAGRPGASFSCRLPAA